MRCPGPGHALRSACNRTDNADAYVDVMPNDGSWDSGNVLFLARVPRTKLSDIRPADYEFYTTGDGATDAGWNTVPAKALPVIANPGRLGERRVQYLPALQRYLLLTYSYPDGLAAGNSNAQHTLWLGCEAPHPWVRGRSSAAWNGPRRASTTPSFSRTPPPAAPRPQSCSAATSRTGPATRCTRPP